MGILNRRQPSKLSVGKLNPDRSSFVSTEYILEKLREAPIYPKHTLPTKSSQYTDIFTPKTFDEYIGQEEAKETALIMINAAKMEHRPLPNILIDGEYGLGKTTLAKIIVQTYGGVSKFIDAASAIKDVPKSGLVVIDEIHNLPSEITDQLNVYLDGGGLQIIGASTDVGDLSAPFRSRFRGLHLHSYSVADLTTMLVNICMRKGVVASETNLREIAKRSRANARLATMNLMFVFDLMTIRNERELTKPTMTSAFTKLGMDDHGFIPRDYAYMRALPEGRAVGVQYIAAVIGIDSKTIEQEIEPYLMRQGLIDRTPRGRIKVFEIESVKGK